MDLLKNNPKKKSILDACSEDISKLTKVPDFNTVKDKLTNVCTNKSFVDFVKQDIPENILREFIVMYYQTHDSSYTRRSNSKFNNLVKSFVTLPVSRSKRRIMV